MGLPIGEVLMDAGAAAEPRGGPSVKHLLYKIVKHLLYKIVKLMLYKFVRLELYRPVFARIPAKRGRFGPLGAPFRGSFVRCEQRGFYRLGPVGLASSFPLGLTAARIAADESIRTLTIYPEVFAILALPLRGAPSQVHRGGYLLPEGAGAAEFAGLREYRRGDNPRHVHWPTTARVMN